MRSASLAPRGQRSFPWRERRPCRERICKVRTLILLTPLLLMLPMLIFVVRRTTVHQATAPEAVAVAAQPQQQSQQQPQQSEAASRDAGGAKRANPLPQADVSVSGVAHRLQEEDSCGTDFLLKPDTDLRHGDMDATPAADSSTLSACCELCRSREAEGCVGVTLTESGECWLKSAVGSAVPQSALGLGLG